MILESLNIWGQSKVKKPNLTVERDWPEADSPSPQR